MKQVVFYFMLVLTLCSCKNRENKFITAPIQENIHYTTEILPTDSIIIKVPENKFAVYHTKAIYKDQFFFGVHLNQRNIIDIYDIDSAKFYKSIEVDNDALSDRISGLYVQSMDSIYFYQNTPRTVFLIDSTGHILQKWTEERLKISLNDHPELSTFPINLITLPIYSPLITGNKMYLTLDPGGAYKLYPQVERVGVYDLKECKWIGFFSKYEDVEYNKKGYSYTYDLEQPYLTQGSNSIIVSYPMDHYVYVFDPNTNELVKKVPVYSKYATDLPVPLKDKDIDNCQKNWNFRVQTPFYGPLYYHEKEQKYTRVIHHAQPLIDGNGMINNGQERLASIIILDHDLNIIGESLFENGDLGVYAYLPLSDGLYISRQADDTYAPFLAFNTKLSFQTR